MSGKEMCGLFEEILCLLQESEPGPQRVGSRETRVLRVC